MTSSQHGLSQPGAADAAPQGTQGHFRRGVFSVGGGSLVGVVVLFVEAVIVARALPVSDLGVYAFFQASLGLLTIAVDLGFRTTAAQFLAAETDNARRARLVSSLTLARLAVVAVASLLVLLSVPVLPVWLNMPALGELLLYMPIILALASLDELGTGLLQGFQRYAPLARAQICRSVLRLALSTVILMVLGLGLKALVISWIASFGLSAILQYLALPVAFRLKFDLAEVRGALKFGMPLQLTRYLWFAMQRVDTFVLTVLTGPLGVAFYDVAGKLPQGLQRLSEAYYAVYHPSLSARFSRQETAAAGLLMRQSLRLFSAATLLAAWGAVLFGHDLIVLLFTERYVEAAPAFVVILVTFSLSSSINLLGYALTASGRPAKSFAVNLLRSAVSFGGDFALIPFFGFIGAAYATLIAQAAAAPLAWWYLRRERLPAHGWLLLRHFLLAGAIYLAHLVLPPLGLPVRLGLLAVFPVLAAGLGLITLDDVALVLPTRRLWPARLAAGAASSSRGTEA